MSAANLTKCGQECNCKDMWTNLINLDVFDLNYAYGERMNLLSYPSSALPKPGVLMRMVSFFWHLLDELLHLKHLACTAPLPDRSILFYAKSGNQMNALQPVLERLTNGYLAGPYNLPVDCRFPDFWAYLLSVPFLPLVTRKYFKASGYRKKTFRYCIDQYLLTYGYYIVAKRWLRRKAPHVLVVSNEYNMHQRVLVKAAHELCITTVYLQHAEISIQDPPLIFDFALLNGIDALQKANFHGPSKTIFFLVGIPKMDAFFRNVNRQATANVIGICTNSLDPIEECDKLCEHIRKAFPDLSIIIRPHPGDKRIQEWKVLAQRHQTDFSDARVELSFEFLKNIDALIVGNSNVLLESALMNVYPLYYDFGRQDLDLHGFLQNGLSEYCASPSQLAERLFDLMQSKPDIQMKTRRYCATIGTEYVGSSSALASKLIQQIAAGVEIDMEQWQRIPSSYLEAYELNSPNCP